MFTTKKFIFAVAIILLFGGCASQREQISDDEFTTEAMATSDLNDASVDEFSDFSDSTVSQDVSANSNEKNSSIDEFAEFDNSSNEVAESTPQTGINDEFAQFDQESPAQVPALDQEFAPNQTTSEPIETATKDVSQVPPAEVAASEPIPEPTALQSSNETNLVSRIESVKYQSNQAGGTLVISADQPLTFKTRQNLSTQQLIVEIENAVLPSALKRTLNTKDMASSIGSVDMYQKSNSKIARFVIQLRPNSPEPLVQPEGNTLLIVGSENPNLAKVKSKRTEDTHPEPTTGTGATKYSQNVNADLTDESVLSGFEVRDFIANNAKFYGKKISIETKDLDIRDTLNFLAEEAGINMVIDDNVSGKLSLKLKSVPWDQALTLVLKAKSLSYFRQGNVLRIATTERILGEQRAANILKNQSENSAPLVVKRFFIGYADVADLEKKIKSFSDSKATPGAGGAGQGQQAAREGNRGSVIGDARTGSLIVTDTQDNLDRIAQLIKALDSQPPQVLIEGKVVEASEKFTRTMGVNWSGGGVASPIGKRSGGRLINFTPSLSQNANTAGGVLNGSMTLGTLDLIGDLTANLSLNERLDKIRVLSAPRITVLTNTEANIDQTTQIMLPSSSTSSTANSTQTQTYQPYSFGVSLKVKPQVSNEATVTLDMEIKRSLLGSGSINGTPAIDERKAKTRVIVKNGQTAVIGGVFQTDANNTKVGVPFLKDIPVLGMLFRGEENTKSKNELIIFLTPKILQNLNADSGLNSNDSNLE